MLSSNPKGLIRQIPLCLVAGILLAGCAVNADDGDGDESVGQSEFATTYNNLESIGWTNSDHTDTTAKSKWVTCSEVGYNSTNCGGAAGSGTLVDTSVVYPYSFTYSGSTWTTAHFTISLNNYNGDGTVSTASGGNAYWYHYSEYNTLSARLSHYEYQMDVFVGNSRADYTAIEFDGNQMWNSKWHVYAWQENTNGDWYYYDKGHAVSCNCSGWINSNHSSTGFGSTSWHHVKMTWTVNSDSSDTVNCLTVDGSSFCPNATVGVGSAGTTTKVAIGLQGDKKTGYSFSGHYKNITLYYY